jgi:phosphatidylserine/phosphatidylglycerophosphate/cardiolipin synthase-like enzyme
VKKPFLFFSILGGIFCFFIWILFCNLSPQIPSKKSAILLYSNQCHSDLRQIMIHAIKKAKKSLFLVTFGLNDLAILESVEKKAKEKLDLKVFYDRKASPNILLSNHQAYALDLQGLVHQKILIVDKKLLFLGSANMTRTSFAADENLIVGFYSPEMCQFLLKKAPFFSGSLKTCVSGQPIELFLLPDTDHTALLALKSAIQSAKKSIFVAMFTLTHPLLVQELILAKKRGVQVKVALSTQMALGASKEAIEKLQREQIPLLLSPPGPRLFHYKFAKIDENILICGSTNWTRAAFAKNHDCFFLLHKLTSSQKKFLKKLTSLIEKNASTCTNSALPLPSSP